MSHPDLLGKTKHGNDGFGSTGVQVIKKGKKECRFKFLLSKVLDDDDIDGKVENQIDAIKGEQSTAYQNTCKMLAMVDKPNDDLQIISEQATMSVDKTIIVSESITIEYFFEMKHNIFYITFLLMTLSKTMFIILTAFLVGYRSGYYFLELLKYKNKQKKFKIEEFLLGYNKKYGLQHGSSNKQLEEVKINKDIFLSND